MIEHKIVEAILDRFRPGWRERQAKKKSPWNLVLGIVGFSLAAVLWYVFFQGAWQMHVIFYPEHITQRGQFWSQGISFKALLSSFLLLLPLGIPALVFGMLAANLLFWCIPPARRTMQIEAAGDTEMTFTGSNAGLLKWGGLASGICFALCILGAATLQSLK